MKKENIKYIGIVLIIIILFWAYNNFLVKPTKNIVLEKEGYYNDCYKVSSSANKAIDLTSLLDSKKLSKNDEDISEQYIKSKCVSVESYSLKKYLVVDDFSIEHEKSRNDQAYQISYQEVLKQLGKKENKSELDKKIIESLKFYLNDSKFKNLVPKTIDNFQEQSILIGPNQNDSSGKYVLAIDIKVAKNNIYKLKNNKRVYKESKYIFDGISMEYIKVGE
ncbi:hypothetical protein OKW22_000091 [Bacilli bacterium PM5-3]|nr:hypothetical protein [Bacilli bacterium PM5-3]MDH6603371.1 hypothetical protein [Bacilli bacterium PM5-9]